MCVLYVCVYYMYSSHVFYSTMHIRLLYWLSRWRLWIDTDKIPIESVWTKWYDERKKNIEKRKSRLMENERMKVKPCQFTCNNKVWIEPAQDSIAPERRWANIWLLTDNIDTRQEREREKIVTIFIYCHHHFSQFVQSLLCLFCLLLFDIVCWWVKLIIWWRHINGSNDSHRGVNLMMANSHHTLTNTIYFACY